MNHILNRLSTIIVMIVLIVPSLCEGKENNTDKLLLYGRIKDAILKQDLTDAMVILYDKDGNPKDTIQTNQGITMRDGERVQISMFNFTIEKRDTVITFDIVCPGYQDKTVVFHIDKIGAREHDRNMGVQYLDRAPKQLGEVTVTATKIKFYNKGDTIVYNADAFQLAEGSMLDALINQMPGVELKQDGQIFVNGELVESLLLNGKQFLDGNNQLMLDNIAAYTVKNVSVYKGQTREEQWFDDPTRPKILTMDVSLKREYNIGWLINAQGGYGTEDRYIGRIFASWFNPTTRITLLGNINNLNDNRSPGKNDSWTPDMMPSGTKQYKMGAMNYDYSNDKGYVNGSISVEETKETVIETTDRINFLQSGDTYDNSYSNSRSRNLKIATRNRGFFLSKKNQIGGSLNASYNRKDNSSSGVSATFDREQADATKEAIEAIYNTDGSSPLLESVINRNITLSDTRSKEWEIEFSPSYARKTNTGDIIYVNLFSSFRSSKEDIFKNYDINFGQDPVAAERRSQYFDNSPNKTIKLGGEIEYVMNFNDIHIDLDYEYRYNRRDVDSYMYALDRLADNGVFGQLPSGYLTTLDPANSYTSLITESRHTFTPRFSWIKSRKEKDRLLVSIAPKLRWLYRHIDYNRENKLYPVSDNTFVTAIGNWGAMIDYNFDNVKDDDGHSFFRHDIRLEYRLTPSSPDLMHLINVDNTADPMNIDLGNPNLKNAYEHKEIITWRFNPRRIRLNNTLTFTATQTSDALVWGYTYDTSTGVRVNKTYNVSGNNSLNGVNALNLQFGPKQALTLTSNTSGTLTNYADMIGVDQEEPTKSTVRTTMLSQSLRLSWQLGKQELSLRGEALTRHTTSTREDFSTINANHYTYGIIGKFILPYGFGINTDFTCYTRRGYGSKDLDTTDAILNIGLSFTPRKSRWVFKVDGFDLLHQLSNVHYAVSASGRTISYTNALPRYVLFTAQYKLNIQPKKK